MSKTYEVTFNILGGDSSSHVIRKCLNRAEAIKRARKELRSSWSTSTAHVTSVSACITTEF